MRIDRFLSECGIATRKEAGMAAKRGQVWLNGAPVRDVSRHMDPDTDRLTFGGQPVLWQPFVYFMLNKPEGYVSATEDGRYPVVTELLPEAVQKRNPFPCGRLDRDTVGLMLLTNDGPLAHRLLAPRGRVSKSYRFTCAEPLPEGAEALFAAGMTLGDGTRLLPATLRCAEDRSAGVVEVTEGKYHQIKRMFGALSNKITFLERVSFGPLRLDPALPRGACRPLTEQEIQQLHSCLS